MIDVFHIGIQRKQSYYYNGNIDSEDTFPAFHFLIDEASYKKGHNFLLFQNNEISFFNFFSLEKDKIRNPYIMCYIAKSS